MKIAGGNSFIPKSITVAEPIFMELRLSGKSLVKISYIKFHRNVMVTFSLHI
jgi:hypothetical protein